MDPRALMFLVALSGVAAAQTTIINTTGMPSSIGGVSKSGALSLVAVGVIVLFSLAFTAMNASLGLFVMAAAVSLFQYMGWIAVPIPFLVLLYAVPLLFALAGRRTP